MLTDPIFSERASPVSFMGPRRVREPGLCLEDLPKIDLILLSHNHYDHMDLPALKKLAAAHRSKVVTLLGNRKLLLSAGFTDVKELDWWEACEPLPDIKVVATPAEHFSGRGLWDRNRALWGGFLLSSQDFKCFFTGDSGYGAHFADVAQRYGGVDLAMLPIGAYRPRWFMQGIHMDPAEAVRAHLDLQSKASVGMHFGTFALADEGPDEPLVALRESMKGLPAERQNFAVLSFGESRNYAITQATK